MNWQHYIHRHHYRHHGCQDHESYCHYHCHRVVKCDVKNIKICELVGFVEIIRAIKSENASLPKFSVLVQIVGEILSVML